MTAPQGHTPPSDDDVSPYLRRPLRSMEEVRRWREEQGRTALGTWLPWEVESEMYRDPEDDGPTLRIFTGGTP